MGDLIDFAKRVKEQLDRSNRESEWSGEEADRYMAEVKMRRQRYVELAAQLLSTVIRQVDSSPVGLLDLLHTHLQAIAGRGAINSSVVCF